MPPIGGIPDIGGIAMGIGGIPDIGGIAMGGEAAEVGVMWGSGGAA